MEDFTIEKALAVQREQLAAWLPKLSAACYFDLTRWVDAANSTITPQTNPYKVVRGSDLTQFIYNWKS